MKMKQSLGTLLITTLLLGSVGCQQETSTAAHTHGDGPGQHTHDDSSTHSHGPDTHTHEPGTPGPHNGRLITSVTPNFEFLVKEDRTVQLTFVDQDIVPVSAPAATVSLVGGDRQNPTELSFAVDDGVLVSSAPLPAGDIVPVILTLQMPGESEPVVERFNVDFSICSECQLVEYACICGH